MNGPRYIMERWPHGWLICARPGQSGIPLDAMSEFSPFFPKNSVMDTGISHHFRASGRPHVVFAVSTPNESNLWRAIIAQTISVLPPQERWWKGMDVGTSSAAMFAVLCEDRFREEAKEFGRGSTPRDADDFGRCHRLIEAFPEWRTAIHRVAEAYPDTKWPAIIERWGIIANLPASEATALLSKL